MKQTNTVRGVSQTALGVQVVRIVPCTKTMLIVKTEVTARVGRLLGALSVIGQTQMACMPVMRVVLAVEAQARARPVQRAQRPPPAAIPKTTACAARILCSNQPLRSNIAWTFFKGINSPRPTLSIFQDRTVGSETEKRLN